MRLTVLGIILAVVVSGCTGTTDASSGGTGGSVVIKSFSADETDVQGNDKVELTTEVVNTGDSRATSVTLQLLDIDLRCGTAPTNPADTSCESTSTQWGLAKGEQRHQINDLRISTGGEQPVPVQYSWRAQAPKVPANLKQPYSAKARVSYIYSTAAQKQIKIITLDEYQRAKARGETFPVTTTKSSNGPLAIDVKVTEPVKVENGITSFMLTVQVDNLAGGTTFKSGTDPNLAANRDWFNINATLPPGLTMLDTGDCAGLIRAGGVDVQLGSKGKTFKMSCEVSANAPSVSTDKTVVVGTQYGYFVDASLPTPITVTGKLSYTTVPGVTTTTTQRGQVGGGGGGGGGGGIDTVSPNAVTGLSTVGTFTRELNSQQLATGRWLATIQFTEPVDNIGVTAFEVVVLKMTAVPAPQAPNDNNWASFTKYSPVPSPVGASRQVAISNIQLDAQSTYKICVKARDAAGNLSPITGACIDATTGQV